MGNGKGHRFNVADFVTSAAFNSHPVTAREYLFQ
jgi:hypothetical protein